MSMPLHVVEHIQFCLDEIAGHFKSPKITVVVRAPQLGDGDLIMTDDNLDEVITAIQRLKARNP